MVRARKSLSTPTLSIAFRQHRTTSAAAELSLPNAPNNEWPPYNNILTLSNALDLELYTTRTDAFCLLALSATLLAVSDAVPLPSSYAGSKLADAAPTAAKKPYARAVILITVLHHIATGIGAGSHWLHPTHNTVAMMIGVYGNIALTVLGVVALTHGLGGDHSEGIALRSGKKLS